MEAQRFDSLTRLLADRATRRQTLKRIGAGVAAIAATALGPKQTEAATCRDVNVICRENSNCCSGVCDPNGARGRRLCTCPAERQCSDKCCDAGEYCDSQYDFCYGPLSGSGMPSIAVAWQKLVDGSALAPMMTLVGFEQRVGARFEIRATPRPSKQVVIQAEVVAIDAPKRLVFDWIAPGMTTPATAEFTIDQPETEMLFGINRVAGDPKTCDLATSLLGSNWRTHLFAKTVTANLKKLQASPE